MPNKSKPVQNANSEKNEDTLLNVYLKNAGLSHYLGVFTQQLYTEELGKLDFVSAIKVLIEEGKRINAGNLIHVERMLLIQAQTLDAMFNNLACRATLTDFAEPLEALLRVALRAQSQCRATLETLANIKNPPQVAFVKQANIGHNQQVNNHGNPENARAEETKNQQNQLLEKCDGKRLDIGTQEKAVNIDKELATVGKVDRPQKSRR